MTLAITLRRHGLVDSRAEAVEVAYDEVLKEATEGTWERTGEVHVDKQASVVRAFCRSDMKALAGKG
jgi:hypothetical protein